MNEIEFLLIYFTSVINCFYTLCIVLYSLFFCNKVFSNYSKALGWFICLMCLIFLVVSNPLVVSLHNAIDFLLQSTWFCIGTILFVQIHRLEMFNREMELNSRTARYLANDYFNKTFIFSKSFLDNFWSLKVVKDFLKNKMFIIELISWVLLIINIVQISILKLGF